MFSSLSFYLPMSAVCLGMMFCGERKLKQRKAHHRSSEGSVSVDQTSISSDSDATTTTTTTQPSIKDRTLARPEKRNHLISSWSRGSPTNDKAQQQHHHDDSLNVGIPQTSDPTKPYSFFGLIPIHSSPKNYALIALFDVYASYTTILAFRYTTITSVALFDAFSIPAAIVVSRVFFGRRYTKIHLLGVLVCCVGISLNVLIDYRDDKKIAEEGDTASAQDQLIEADYPHKIAGDFLAIIGGILFGVVSTLQEVTVKDGGLTEYLGCFAFFASIIAFVQAILTERQEIVEFFSQPASETCSDSEGELLFVLFAIGCIVKYVANGAFLQLSDAAFFNLR
jgi:drug/metabolite transporter (DMT)-like permease